MTEKTIGWSLSNGMSLEETFGSFENGYQNRCVEKEWYFILTEELHTLAKFTIGLIL
jgi:hypothetical protein